ncbi:winged helix-turn-helix domain-containing protein [Parabacteroides bouchesdurhonensis]|uniref:winged helix-turn-helix domain-containing protein n=1 Tax=Parabacteroides bouchesdurhonensis TaxID=1936995 RepID=UPI000E51F6E9|nr:winged helix-turn-helix domain-containing protein [Parabacteroides bouchesdurhonensis]RHJ92467.1 hypothetical protein DW095_07400 [Bacteroides sp. AM07-16]
MIELIGTNAGLVWNVLNEEGKMSVKAVKKATKIKAEKDIYAAFGWLAKEGKLAFDEIDGEVFVSLV